MKRPLVLLSVSLLLGFGAAYGQIIGGGGGGGVSNVGSGCGLTGGPITGVGTLSRAVTLNLQTGTTYTVANGDCGKLISQNNAAASAYTLPQAGNAGSFAAGWFVQLQNRGAGTLTLTPTVSTIDGAATLVLAQGQGAYIVSDGTNYYTLRGSGLSAVANDTNLQGSISGATLTLAWAGTLATSRGGLGSSYAACTGAPTFSAGVSTCSTATGTLGSVVYSNSPTISAPTISGHPTIEGVTSTGATGTGNLVFSLSPTFSTSIVLAGSSSGAITIQPQAAAGTYNFNLPTAAGTPGQPLLSGGGGASPMTFGTLGVAAGGTGLASGTSGGILCFTASTTIASSAALTANLPVIGGGAGACPTLGTVTGSTTLFATSIGTQTSTAIVKIDASGNHIASGWTIDANNNMSGPTGFSGYWSLAGKTSGSVGMTTGGDVAGSAILYMLPTSPSSGGFLKDNGPGVCPTLPTGAPATCEAMIWANPAGSGTVAGSSSGQIAVYTAATTVTGGATLTFSAGALSIGADAATQGSINLSGSGGGHTTISVPSSGGGTWSVQAGTDTFVGRATTDTLTNKTLNCFSGNTCTAATAPTSVSTSTPVTVTTTAPFEFYFNENATASTAVNYSLPTAAAGLEFCFANAYNGTAANTGVLTIATSAAGQFLIDVDGSIGSTGGHIVSGGAGGDSACVVGVDSTHWRVYVQKGTWTKN